MLSTASAGSCCWFAEDSRSGGTANDQEQQSIVQTYLEQEQAGRTHFELTGWRDMRTLRQNAEHRVQLIDAVGVQVVAKSVVQLVGAALLGRY